MPSPRTIKGFARSWSDEMDSDLRSMIEAGVSFSEIAASINAKFGTAFSRNAAIGRAHRTGLQGFIRPKPKKQPKPPRQSTRKIRVDRPIVRTPEFIAQLAAVDPLHVTLSDLQPGQCRYPFGEGPYTFCGNPQCANSSYCDPHRILCTGEGTASERGVAPVPKPRKPESTQPEIQEAA